ncbi:MAG: two-component sensor histidine kinase [Burkholderiales bacterium PBB4]|nr:MAG: two-component sensor histidine kinase [Burkholderiales bacterium PBB4]
MTGKSDPLPMAGHAGDAARMAALEARVAELQAEMQSLTSTLSHDLQAPLRHITSFAQLLEDEAGPVLDGEMREFLGHISGSAKTLGAMLDALLALSRVGTVALQLEPVSLADVVQAEVQVQQRKLASLQAPRVLQWSVGALPAVVADGKLLQQALVQVLDNAVKFTAQQAQAEIQVEAHRDATTGKVLCTVRDNGVGFAAAQASQLFKPFARLHSPRQFPGLGMGLAQVRKSLLRMQGAVSITAAPEGGCTVVLELPAAEGGCGIDCQVL